MRPRFDIQGEIGADANTSAQLGAFLRANPADVSIYINSHGGDAMEGAALMAEVERHGNVTAFVQGIAASAATLPTVAARQIVMHPTSMLMIHEPAAFLGGTADDHRSAADTLGKMAQTYAAAYSRHTGHPVKRIMAWMNAETWLTAEEALELNFCDRIEAFQDAAPMVAAFDYTKFRAAPEQLLRLAQKNGWATGTPDNSKTEKANA